MSAVFASPNSNCCSPVVNLPTVPLSIANPPGLSSIQYRIGTFTSFRRAMLQKIAMPDLMAGAVTTLAADVAPTDQSLSIVDVQGFPATAPFRIKIDTEYLLVTGSLDLNTWLVTRSAPSAHSLGDPVTLDPANPFSGWHEGIGGDYQTMFVELWAYLGDVLTFYQERIANEAFLGTATQRDSLLRLVSLIDYRPSPGAAASGLIAFTVGKNRSLTVPAGFRIGSRASAIKPAVVFETAAAITATDNNNAIPLALRSPAVPFDPGTIVLQGVNNRVAVNDFLLAVENESTANEASYLLQVIGVGVDQNATTTKIEWQDVLGVYQQASKQVSLYAFEVTAAPFGAAAPRWDTLPPGLTHTTEIQSPPSTNPPYPDSWDSPFQANSTTPDPMFFAPLPSDPQNQLYLDSAYDQLKYSSTNPGWAVLRPGVVLQPGAGSNEIVEVQQLYQVFHVRDARQVSKVAYSLSAKSTRLTFVETIKSFTFPFRSTTVLSGSVRLPIQINVPLSDPLSGSQLTLTGNHSDLQDGQQVVLRGNLFGTNQAGSEPAIVDGTPLFDSINNITVINLKRKLANQYIRATCSLLANVVAATQGETVKDEVLGSGDGTAFQSYSLKKSPLTYLPLADPESTSAVTSTLIVTVDGVAWQEQRNLLNSAADAHDYATSLDDSDTTTVVFGDGLNGARPTRGVNNIHARYRKGLGTSGNLATDSVQQLINSIPNLQKVTNPLPTAGGSDPASPAEIRVLAPGSLQTFGRAVSTQDYAALTLSYPGIAKASATWVLQDPVTLQAVPRPYLQVTAATVDRVPFQGTTLASNLRRFLDTHRDPNILLRIQDFTPVYIAVAIGIDIDPRYPHQATLNQVQAALNPGLNPDGSAGYFAFEALQFGQSILLSALYAAIQAIPGVQDAVITALRRVGPGFSDAPSQPPHDIVIRPTELVTIDSTANADSTLTITAQGGFSDV